MLEKYLRKLHKDIDNNKMNKKKIKKYIQNNNIIIDTFNKKIVQYGGDGSIDKFYALKNTVDKIFPVQKSEINKIEFNDLADSFKTQNPDGSEFKYIIHNYDYGTGDEGKMEGSLSDLNNYLDIELINLYKILDTPYQLIAIGSNKIEIYFLIDPRHNITRDKIAIKQGKQTIRAYIKRIRLIKNVIDIITIINDYAIVKYNLGETIMNETEYLKLPNKFIKHNIIDLNNFFSQIYEMFDYITAINNDTYFFFNYLYDSERIINMLNHINIDYIDKKEIRYKYRRIYYFLKLVNPLVNLIELLPLSKWKEQMNNEIEYEMIRELPLDDITKLLENLNVIQRALEQMNNEFDVKEYIPPLPI
jgi:hypothetical protein